jgi:predicted enzyme related to lactoylglutathione lyase
MYPLKKIDCVMVYVENLAEAKSFYCRVFGLRELWNDEGSIGLGLLETDAEIVLHNDPTLPSKVEVYYLVENVVAAVDEYERNGCRVLVPPFPVVIGDCAVIEDPFATRLCLLDMTKGARA